VGPRAGIDAVTRSKVPFLASPGNRTTASSPSLVPILAEVMRLPSLNERKQNSSFLPSTKSSDVLKYFPLTALATYLQNNKMSIVKF
jgi:hypothetical protein